MMESELGLRCENCGTVYVIHHLTEKVDKKCRYCDCQIFESVEVIAE